MNKNEEGSLRVGGGTSRKARCATRFEGGELCLAGKGGVVSPQSQGGGEGARKGI